MLSLPRSMPWPAYLTGIRRSGGSSRSRTLPVMSSASGFGQRVELAGDFQRRRALGAAAAAPGRPAGIAPGASDENAPACRQLGQVGRVVGLDEKSGNSILPLTRLTGPKLHHGGQRVGWPGSRGAAAWPMRPMGGRRCGDAALAVAAGYRLGFAASLLTMSLRLMRPGLVDGDARKKSTRLVSPTCTLGAVPGAVATFRPRRFRLFQASGSSPTWPRSWG